LQELGTSPVNAAWAAMGIILVLRLLALRFGLTLPTLGQTR
jgi:uncharacterized membrane protein YeiH